MPARNASLALAICILASLIVPPASGAVTMSPQQESLSSVSGESEELIGRRTRDAKVFRNPDGTYTAEIGYYLHYEAAPGRWEDVDLHFRGEGTDFVVDRHDILFRVHGAHMEAMERETGQGVRWLTPVPPAVAGRTASYQARGHVWTYATRKSGLKLAAQFGVPQGPQTYDFVYRMLGGTADFSVDEGGNLVSDDVLFVPRAAALGADGNYYPAGAWELLPGPRVQFAFDDSVLPPEAYPYELDPTTIFLLAAGGGTSELVPVGSSDDGEVYKQGNAYEPGGTATPIADGTIIEARRSSGCGVYCVGVGLVRFNTGDDNSIPSNASVSAATLSLHITNKNVNDGDRYFKGEWYDADSTVDIGDYAAHPPSDTNQVAFSGTKISDLVVGTTNDFVLPNAATRINTSGYTGFRLHITGAVPSGPNNVRFQSKDGTTDAQDPRLRVTYTVPNAAPTIDSVSESPDPVTIGGTLTFEVRWSDPGDSVKNLICRSNSLNGTSCSSEWVSDGLSSSSPTSLDYTTSSADGTGMKNYWAFVCDAAGQCSSGSAGSFTVQPGSPPSVTDAQDYPDPVVAGQQITFKVFWSNPDSGESVSALICRSNSVQSGSCAGQPWASAGQSSTSPITTTATPTASEVGLRNYWAFVCDPNGTCSTSRAGSFQVSEPGAYKSEYELGPEAYEGPHETNPLLEGIGTGNGEEEEIDIPDVDYPNEPVVPAGPGVEAIVGEESILDPEEQSVELLKAPLTQFEGPRSVNVFPPDPTIAAGPAHLVVMTNTSVVIYDKAGGEILTQSTTNFFKASSGQSRGFAFDPTVMFDPTSNRFVASVASRKEEEQRSWIHVAVSSSPDPTQRWYAYHIDAESLGGTTPDVSEWADRPRLGVNALGVYVAADMFPWGGGTPHSDLWSFLANDLAAGKHPIDFFRFRSLLDKKDGTDAQHVQPALVMGAGENAWMVATCCDDGSNLYFTVYNIRWTESAEPRPKVTSVGWKSSDGGPSDPPPNPPQNSTVYIDARWGRSVQAAVFRQGKLWWTHSIASQTTGRSMVQIWELNVPDHELGWSHRVGLSQGLHLYNPSFAVNTDGTITMTFAASSTNRNPTMGYVKLSSGSWGTPTLLRDSFGPCTAGNGRFGDYAGASPDPNKQVTAWIINETCGFDDPNAKWSTWVAEIS